MNSSEQKSHKRVTDDLAQSIEALSEAFNERIAEINQDWRASVGDERTHRLKLAEEQRSYVDARNKELRAISDDRWDATARSQKLAFDRLAECEAFRNRGFFARLRWLFRGR